MVRGRERYCGYLDAHMPVIGCHNPQTWDKNSGVPFDSDAFKEITDALSEPFCNGLTLSGGDPLAPFNYEEILSLCKKVKQMFPEKTIWVYSGFTYDFIKENRSEILNYIDVLGLLRSHRT